MSDTLTPAARRDFAPISGEPSGRLRFVAGYFALSGGLGVLALCVNVVVAETRGNANLMTLGLIAGFGSLIIGSLFWTARELRRKNKWGWYAGLIAFGAPIISAIAGKPLAPWTIAVSLVGLGLLVSVRREVE